jgi:hypothetical protein
MYLRIAASSVILVCGLFAAGPIVSQNQLENQVCEGEILPEQELITEFKERGMDFANFDVVGMLLLCPLEPEAPILDATEQLGVQSNDD